MRNSMQHLMDFWKNCCLALVVLAAPLSLNAQISGATQACPGSLVDYSFDDTSPCDSSYSWSVTPGVGTIVGPSDGSTVTVQWLTDGIADLCVEVGDSCLNSSQTHCTPVTVVSIPVSSLFFEICPGECVLYNGQNLCTPGAYNFTFTSYLGCDSVTVVNLSTIAPIFVDLGTVTLDCVNPIFEACGTIYNQPGAYTATCISSLGCDSLVNFVLEVSTDLPVAEAGPDLLLTCNQTSVTLDGSGSSQGPSFVYEWTGPNGFSSNMISPVVNEPGNYCLIVTDATNGCTASDCMVVIADIAVPAVSIFADPFPCDGSPAQITVTVTGGVGPYEYNWTTIDGNIVSGATTIAPWVDAGGTYCVSVVDLPSGCEAVACITVEETILPAPLILPAALPCDGPATANLLAAGYWPNPAPNFEFAWSTANGNIVSGETTPSIVVDVAGLYCVTVSDALTGCTREECDTVYEKIHVELFPASGVCDGEFAEFLVQTVAGPDATPYNLSIEMNGLPFITEVLLEPNFPFSALIDGTTNFKIWAEAPSGDCVSDTVEVAIEPEPLPLSFVIEENGCNPVTATAIIDLPPPQNFIYTWSDDEGNIISSDISISTTESAWFYLSVNEVGGCEWQDSIFVPVDFSGMCAYVEGNIWQVTTANCIPSADDIPIENWLVQVSGTSTFYGNADADGFYAIPVDPGSYTVSIFPPNPFWVPCVNDIPVDVPNADDTGVANFFLEKLPGCPQMTVDISTWQLRRCFSNNHYYVNYCNEGVEDAIDAYVEINFDPYLTLINSAIPAIDLGNNTYQFDIGDVAVGECGTFWAQVEVSCDAALGETHCTEAHIYPDTLCTPPDPQWTGANLETDAECADSLRFTITNTGTGAMADALNYVVIEDAVMYMEVIDGPVLGPGESFEFAVPANGSTWRLEVTQEAFHPSESLLEVAAITACGVNAVGGTSTGFVEMFSMFDEDPFIDIDCTDNIGAYDPNDKYGSPVGYGDDHYILPGTDIEYRIRFQNTGTDTAFNIVIRDTLTEMLDVTTVRPGASSHDYEFEVYGEGILKFKFPNIELPDSNVNEPLSHGFVEFKVSHREGLTLGTVIENSAAIYFDFNEPVITNTTDHELAEDFIMVNQVHVAVEDVDLSVFPNPFEETVRFELDGLGVGKQLVFNLLDARGQLLASQKFDAPSMTFHGSDLPLGLYFFKIEIGGELVASGKIYRQ